MKTKQQLSFLSLTAIVVSLIIGMGIFKTPATIAAKAGTQNIFFLAWIIGGAITMLGALIYAEIGQRLPAMGGYYKIFSYCYRPAIGFTINILILISNAASAAVIALIGADYVSDFLFGQPSGNFFNATIAAISVAAFYLLNLAGLRTSSAAQNILTIIKISLIVLLIATIFKTAEVIPHGYNEGRIYSTQEYSPLILFFISLVSVLFTYGGYQQTINFGAESSSKIMYRSIIGGVLIAISLYLAINYAYVKAIGFEQMKNANAIGSLLIEAWFKNFGSKVFDCCMILSVMAYVNVVLLSNPRVMFSMSEDGVLPKIFQKINPKSGALTYGLTIFSIIIIIIAFCGKKVDDILSFSIFLDCIGMTTSSATLFILRKRNQGNSAVVGKIKKFTPIFCVVFIASYVAVSIAVVIDKPLAALMAVILLVVFFCGYKVFARKLF